MAVTFASAEAAIHVHALSDDLAKRLALNTVVKVVWLPAIHAERKTLLSEQGEVENFFRLRRCMASAC